MHEKILSSIKVTRDIPNQNHRVPLHLFLLEWLKAKGALTSVDKHRNSIYDVIPFV